jgi:site-specific recombinase XerC
MAKSGPAFGAPSSEHVLAGFCRHSFHKSMLTAALAFFGLISLFGHSSTKLTQHL